MADIGLNEIPSPSVPLERGGIIFFYISLAAFLITLATLGGMIFLNNAEKKTRDELQEEIKQKEANFNTSILQEIFTLEQRLINLQTVLTNHKFTSNVLRSIEVDTHPLVRFFGFSFSDNSKKVNMGGETTSYAVLARQIAQFEADPQIEQVEFGGLSFSSATNLLGFKLTLTLKPSLLQLRPQP